METREVGGGQSGPGRGNGGPVQGPHDRRQCDRCSESKEGQHVWDVEKETQETKWSWRPRWGPG